MNNATTTIFTCHVFLYHLMFTWLLWESFNQVIGLESVEWDVRTCPTWLHELIITTETKKCVFGWSFHLLSICFDFRVAYFNMSLIETTDGKQSVLVWICRLYFGVEKLTTHRKLHSRLFVHFFYFFSGTYNILVFINVHLIVIWLQGSEMVLPVWLSNYSGNPQACTWSVVSWSVGNW